MKAMERYARIVFALLLGVLAVGEAYGQQLDNSGNWTYKEVNPGKTCKIAPADRSKIVGAVDIPERLIPANGGAELLVTAIGDGAFDSCAGLTAITIPSSVTAIGDGAFNGCAGLTAVTIPSSVTAIGDGAFNGCENLIAINVAPTNTVYASEGGVLFNMDKTMLICYPSGKQGAYSIPSGVQAIGNGAFFACVGLTGVTFPNSMTTIEAGAFFGCTGLTGVDIPGSVTTIGENAFTFCTGLSEVTIPRSVSTIGMGAFAICNSMTAIRVAQKNTAYASLDGVLFNQDKTTLICYPSGKQGAYTIPSGVKDIEDYAFSYCPKLITVKIPNSVTTIGEGAFENCGELAEINVDQNNRNFSSEGGVLFNYNKTTLIRYPQGKDGAYPIPTSVETIEAGAFSGCAGLTAVTIPAGVKAVKEFAFSDCRNLALVRWYGDDKATVKGSGFDRNAGKKRVLRVNKGQAAKFNNLTWVNENKFIVSDAQAVVVLNANGGTLPDGSGRKIVELQSTPAKLSESEAAEPIRDGCKFQGYFKEGEAEKFNFNNEITDYLVLVARWDRYEVQFLVYGDYDKELEGAEVKVNALSKKTDKDGNVGFLLPNGEYTYEASLANYVTQSGRLAVRDRDVQLLVLLPKQPSGGSTPTPPSAVESVQLAAARAVQNPIGSTLMLEGIRAAERIEVYSLAGIQTYVRTLRGEARVEVATKGWANGIYLVRIIATDGEKTIRVVKR